MQQLATTGNASRVDDSAKYNWYQSITEVDQTWEE